jgi:hypothetical protein
MYERIREWQFEKTVGAVYQQIFSGREARRSSFRNSTWDFALIYRSFRWNKSEFETICRAACSVGDLEMIMTSLQVEPLHRWTCRIRSDYESLIEVMGDRDLGYLAAVNKALWGPSGVWGLITDECVAMPLGYAIIGGEKAFMNGFIQSRGGYPKMREDFLRLLDDPWISSHPTSEIGRSLLDEVGW